MANNRNHLAIVLDRTPQQPPQRLARNFYSIAALDAIKLLLILANPLNNNSSSAIHLYETFPSLNMVYIRFMVGL